MTQEEVDSFLKEKNISVSVMMEHGYNKDDDWAEEVRKKLLGCIESGHVECGDFHT